MTVIRSLFLTLGAPAVVLLGVLRAAAQECPAGTKAIGLVPYARDSASCAVIVSCANLDSKTRVFTCRFFATGVLGGSQVGIDATRNLGASELRICGTKGVDPLAIRLIDSSAATGGFEGYGLICSDTAKLACQATLSCNLVGGPLAESLKIVAKKQRGD
jgi:hypothetical protein